VSGSASLGLEQAVLGHTLGFAPMTAPTQVFVALCLAAPAAAPAEGTPGTEVSGLGYYRTPAVFALATSPANMAANVAVVEFPIALAAWGTVGYFELWDAQVGGNRLYWGQLIDHTSGVPAILTVASSDIVRFSPGTLGVQAASGVGGVSSAPWLPVAGGTMTGPLTLAGNATLPLQAVPLQQLTAATAGVVVPVPPGGSIQAAHDALPATGGSILLAANTTYVITAQINLTKPNVHISAPSWGTILRRDPAFTTGGLLVVSGVGSIVEGFTIDGNSVVHNVAELGVTGNSSLIRNMQIINSAGSIFLSMAGQNSRATGNTITGLGTSLATQRGQGIWAFNHQTVMIDHNVISGINTSAIGCDGEGSQIIGNTMTNCHTWTGGPGGAMYFGTAGNPPVGNAMSIIGNYIGGGGPQAQGIEVWMPNTMVSGNVIENVPEQSIILFTSAATITGNTIRNCGATANIDAIYVPAGITDFVISGNHIYDDRATPIMRAGIYINAGASNRYSITGNLITGATLQGIVDQGSGTTKTVADNPGSNATLSGSVNFTAGATFNNSTAASSTDLSKQIQFAPGHGISYMNSGRITAVSSQNIYFTIGTTDVMSIWSNGPTMVGGLGVWGHAIPATQPAFTGAKGGNTALASVIAVLAAYGIGTDSTSA
jgi:nitrous oxidase accessory protein NosD